MYHIIYTVYYIIAPSVSICLVYTHDVILYQQQKLASKCIFDYRVLTTDSAHLESRKITMYTAPLPNKSEQNTYSLQLLTCFVHQLNHKTYHYCTLRSVRFLNIIIIIMRNTL